MEGLINIIVGNWDIVLSSSIVLLLLFLLVYELDGFLTLFRKAAGTVLQKICSLLIEAICLVVKIINCLEIYVVLLIDALTGKATANGKIASLAIGVLSVASFYTTYTGMKSFMDEDTVAFLITLGIQAILLSTSLRISEVLEFEYAKKMRRKGFGALSLCAVSCMMAYILAVVNISYRIQKSIYHILYLTVIVSFLSAIVSFIKNLNRTSMKNRSHGMILLIIYFAVLSVSSFFSYNAFVTVLYPDSARKIDTFQAYKVNVIELMDRLNDEVDDKYYEDIRAELIVAMKELQYEISNMDKGGQMTNAELKLSQQKEAFEDYLKKIKELEKAQGEREEENKRWNELYDSILNNSGGIGPNTKALIDAERESHDERIKEIEDEERKLMDNVAQIDTYIVDNADLYVKMKEKQNAQEEGMDCTEEVEFITRILKRDSMNPQENVQLIEAVNKVEEARIRLLAASTNTERILENDISDMIQVYRGYKDYRNKYGQIFQKIQGVSPNGENYQEAQEKIEKYAYEILQALPETSYIFYGKENNMLQTFNLSESNYYNSIEILKRRTNPDISQTEKNIRTFVDNKMLGILCALLALLIDMMILFVGIILPKGIDFCNLSVQEYSKEDAKRILSNVFNKPIGR